jgi:hypothetical protein
MPLSPLRVERYICRPAADPSKRGAKGRKKERIRKASIDEAYTATKPRSRCRLEDTLFAIKQRKAVPHEFVLDAIAPLSPETRSMFGCLAVYVLDKIILILRDKRDGTADNGVWLATTEGTPPESAAGVPDHALDSGVREEGDRLAGPPGRREGFRRGRAARLRPCPRRRSSNREGFIERQRC